MRATPLASPAGELALRKQHAAAFAQFLSGHAHGRAGQMEPRCGVRIQRTHALPAPRQWSMPDRSTSHPPPV